MSDPFACQCTRYPQCGCQTRATQEDALCDACRAGCYLIAMGPERTDVNMDNALHVRIHDFKFSAVPPVQWPVI